MISRTRVLHSPVRSLSFALASNFVSMLIGIGLEPLALTRQHGYFSLRDSGPWSPSRFGYLILVQVQIPLPTRCSCFPPIHHARSHNVTRLDMHADRDAYSVALYASSHFSPFCICSSGPPLRAAAKSHACLLIFDGSESTSNFHPTDLSLSLRRYAGFY